MRYGIKVTVPPTEEPVGLYEAKTWLVIGDTDLTDRNSLIEGLIKAARERAELETQRAFVTQTIRLSLDRFPWCDEGDSEGHSADGWDGLIDGRLIRPFRPPLQSVTSITYVDTAGVLQTLSTSLYDVDTDSEPGRIGPAYGQVWPVARAQLNAVKVTYVAGYGAATAVPEGIKTAIKLMVAHWYLHPEEVSVDNLAPIPLGAKAILDGFWSGGYA